MRRFLLVGILALIASDADAGPIRRWIANHRNSEHYDGRNFSTSQTSEAASCIGGACEIGSDSIPTPTTAITDALDEVNAKRATRGLPPYIRDDGLTIAAQRAADARAASLTFGHTSNDFAFLPVGCSADSAGCAAYPPEYGWLSCLIWENARYAGAAYTVGVDGRRFMHIYIRR